MQQNGNVPSIARQRFAEKFNGELNGSQLPTKKFFTRILAKFQQHGSVKNLVCNILHHSLDKLKI